MDRLIRLPELEKTVGLRRSALYKRISEGRFPAPVRLDGRAVAWKASDVEKWIGDLPPREARP